jgi:hypothetical protein
LKIKEEAINSLGEMLCQKKDLEGLIDLLKEIRPYMDQFSKIKTALLGKQTF